MKKYLIICAAVGMGVALTQHASQDEGPSQQGWELIEGESVGASLRELVKERVQGIVKFMEDITTYAAWKKGKTLLLQRLYGIGFSSENALLQAAPQEGLLDDEIKLLRQSLIEMRTRVTQSLWPDIRNNAEEPGQKSVLSIVGVSTPSATLEHAYGTLYNIYTRMLKDDEFARKSALNERFLKQELYPLIERISVCFLYDIELLRNRFAEVCDILESKGKSWNPGPSTDIWNKVLGEVLREFIDRGVVCYFSIDCRILEMCESFDVNTMWVALKSWGGTSQSAPYSIPSILFELRQNPGVRKGGVSLSGSLYSDLFKAIEEQQKLLYDIYQKRKPPEQAAEDAEKKTAASWVTVSILSEQDQQAVRGYIDEFFEAIKKDSSRKAINSAGEILRNQLVKALKKYKALFQPGLMIKHNDTQILPPVVTQAWGEYIGRMINNNIPKDFKRRSRVSIQAQIHSDKVKSLIDPSDTDINAIFDEAFKFITVD